jgi:hypothetical protein
MVWMTVTSPAPTPGPDPDPDPNPQPAKAPQVLHDIAALRENEVISAKQCVKRLREDMKEILAVKHRIEEMHTNEQGRKIASKSEWVQQFTAIVGLVAMDNVEKWNEGLHQLEFSIANAEPANIKDGWLDEHALESLDESITGASVEFKNVGRMLDALSHKLPSKLSPNSPTLQDTIERQEQAWADSQLTRLGEARKAAEAQVNADLKEIASQIASTEQEIVALKAQAKLDAAAYEKEKTRIEKAHAESLREEEARLDDLERQFAIEFPKFEEYLKAFTNDGYDQPHGKQFVRTTTKGPVSYSKLLGSGMLKEESLFWFQERVSKSDREQGAFPPTKDSRVYPFETVVAIQAFLREFGPILVKKKKLAP